MNENAKVKSLPVRPLKAVDSRNNTYLLVQSVSSVELRLLKPEGRGYISVRKGIRGIKTCRVGKKLELYYNEPGLPRLVDQRNYVWSSLNPVQSLDYLADKNFSYSQEEDTQKVV